MTPIVQGTKDGAVLTVHVQPKASRTECVGLHGDALKIRVAAQPIDGAANEELIRFLADRCRISRASILIQSGGEGRRKRLYLKGISAEKVTARLLSDGSRER